MLIQDLRIQKNWISWNRIFSETIRGRFNKKTDNIVIYEGAVAKEELTFAAGEIIRLTRLCGYRYNEIAIVTADMDGYGKLAANILKSRTIYHIS